VTEGERAAAAAALAAMLEREAEGELTADILLSTPAEPDAGLIEAEIALIGGMIDREPFPSARHTDLCAAFRALNWARSPRAFARPSECVNPGEEHE
jgi:hypothetical protein